MENSEYALIANTVLKNIDGYLATMDKEEVVLLLNTFSNNRCLTKGNERMNNYFNDLLKLFRPALSNHDGTKFNVLLICAEDVGLTGDCNVGDILIKKIRLFIREKDNKNSDNFPNCCFY